ncbi:hypothetical protein [Frigidibacter mobilis]|uniref:Uncharacterized protein n=1 Tax=Frigidibacter mobilis TaxID=1335048 RepID=A0A159Z1R8_9RHOB|nr:hypothetical protein AKL17_1665 [Frigidibacter mobilis]
MIGRSLRIGVERGSGLFDLERARPPHGRVIRERMVEIRPAERGDELLEVLPLRRGKDVRSLVSEIVFPQRQMIGERSLGAICLIDIVHRAQDARIGQDIAQPDVNGLQSVQRVLAIPAFRLIEVVCLGDGAQILRQPMPLQRGVARAFAHAGGDSLGIDTCTLQGFGEARLCLIVVEAVQRVLAQIGTRIDAIVGRRVEQGSGAIPERVEMRDRGQDIGKLALDLRPRRGRRREAEVKAFARIGKAVEQPRRVCNVFVAEDDSMLDPKPNSSSDNKLSLILVDRESAPWIQWRTIPDGTTYV